MINAETEPEAPHGELERAIASAEAYLEVEAEPGDEAAASSTAEDLRSMVEALEGLLMMGFGMLATRRGELWAISSAEARGIAEPLAEILQRSGLGIDSPEARLAVAAGVVVVPRWIADRRQSLPDGQDD